MHADPKKKNPFKNYALTAQNNVKSDIYFVLYVCLIVHMIPSRVTSWEWLACVNKIKLI